MNLISEMDKQNRVYEDLFDNISGIENGRLWPPLDDLVVEWLRRSLLNHKGPGSLLHHGILEHFFIIIITTASSWPKVVSVISYIEAVQKPA